LSFFLYRFTPRPDFAETMTDAEKAVMQEHIAYWQQLADQRTAVVFGPVGDPGGGWGVAVVEVDDEEAAAAIRAADPVVVNGLGPMDIHPMPMAITRA
jgi:uncharacterized protein YciI